MEAQKRNRGSGRPWPKGVSGNPGGRSKIVAHVQELAREQTATAIETLTSIMTNPKCTDAARVSAANALLDRGYGKPLQQSEVTNIEPGSRRPEDLTDAELVAFIDRHMREESKDETGEQQPNPRTLLAAN
jgi:hypothetical protein